MNSGDDDWGVSFPGILISPEAPVMPDAINANELGIDRGSSALASARQGGSLGAATATTAGSSARAGA